MSLLHLHHRRRLSLLAAGALDGSERQSTLVHVAACAGCARELAELRAVLARFDADPARSAEMRIGPAALTARVLLRLEETPAARSWTPGWR